MSCPTNVSEVRAFTGMVNYYERFIPHLNTILHPLNKLLNKNVPFHWSTECERAFNKTKKAFISDNILVYFDPKVLLVLATDASPYGVDTVLSHRYPDRSEKVIRYASQALPYTSKVLPN